MCTRESATTHTVYLIYSCNVPISSLHDNAQGHSVCRHQMKSVAVLSILPLVNSNNVVLHFLLLMAKKAMLQCRPAYYLWPVCVVNYSTRGQTTGWAKFFNFVRLTRQRCLQTITSFIGHCVHFISPDTYKMHRLLQNCAFALLMRLCACQLIMSSCNRGSVMV